MAINKKIKSFSPYNYNIQYAKPGAGLNQRGKQYIKSSPVNQEEYVITKKCAKFFTFLSNEINYRITDDCENKFLKMVSKFSIRKDKIIKPYSDVYEISNKLTLKEVTVKNENSYDYTIINNRVIQINHNFGSSIDAILLLNDVKYLNFTMKKITDNSTQFILYEDVFTNSGSFVKVLIYPIEESFNILDNIISYDFYENNDLIFDEVKNIIAIDNKSGSSKLCPLVYNTNDETYLLNGYDLNPSYVSFNKGIFNSRSSYKANISGLTEKLNQIINDNLNIKEEVLYETNPEYRQTKDLINDYKNRSNLLETLNIEYDIKKILLYKINGGLFSKILTYNINDNNLVWSIEDGNYIVTIKHYMNSIVKVILDGSGILDVDIYKIDNDTIKINFGKHMPTAYTLNLFKVK